MWRFADVALANNFMVNRVYVCVFTHYIRIRHIQAGHMLGECSQHNNSVSEHQIQIGGKIFMNLQYLPIPFGDRASTY